MISTKANPQSSSSSSKSSRNSAGSCSSCTSSSNTSKSSKRSSSSSSSSKRSSSSIRISCCGFMDVSLTRISIGMQFEPQIENAKHRRTQPGASRQFAGSDHLSSVAAAFAAAAAVAIVAVAAAAAAVAAARNYQHPLQQYLPAKLQQESCCSIASACVPEVLFLVLPLLLLLLGAVSCCPRERP